MWLQAASTKAATQEDTSRPLKQLAHAAFAVDSAPKKFPQSFESAPPAHALAAPARSTAGQTCCCGRGDERKAAGHPGYGPGHCALRLAQVRGEMLTSHVDGGASALQSSHERPASPHRLSAYPSWQLPWESQHPRQLCEHGMLPSGAVHSPAYWQVAPTLVQSAQSNSPMPHCVSDDAGETQFPNTSQHPIPQFIGPHTSPASAPGAHCSPRTDFVREKTILAVRSEVAALNALQPLPARAPIRRSTQRGMHPRCTPPRQPWMCTPVRNIVPRKACNLGTSCRFRTDRWPTRDGKRQTGRSSPPRNGKCSQLVPGRPNLAGTFGKTSQGRCCRPRAPVRSGRSRWHRSSPDMCLCTEAACMRRSTRKSRRISCNRRIGRHRCRTPPRCSQFRIAHWRRSNRWGKCRRRSASPRRPSPSRRRASARRLRPGSRWHRVQAVKRRRAKCSCHRCLRRRRLRPHRSPSGKRIGPTWPAAQTEPPTARVAAQYRRLAVRRLRPTNELDEKLPPERSESMPSTATIRFRIPASRDGS